MKLRVIFFVIVSALLLSGSVSAQGYVPGEILVGFTDDTSEDEADALIKSYGLTWEPQFQKSFSYWAEVENGLLEDHIKNLESSEIVDWAARRGYPEGEKGASYLLVQFVEDAGDEEARNLLNSLEGISLVEKTSSNNASRWGVVKVPVGEELKWVDKFSEEDIVRYAELNGTLSIQSDDSVFIQRIFNSLYFIVPIGLIFLLFFFVIKKSRQK